MDFNPHSAISNVMKALDGATGDLSKAIDAVKETSSDEDAEKIGQQVNEMDEAINEALAMTQKVRAKMKKRG